jgi:FAD/FMN-containing dehydrogenase
VTDLRAVLRGAALVPGEPGYDAARVVWNAMVNKRPEVIVRCAGAADVTAAVNFARNSGLPLSIRGGGHSAAGRAVCEGGRR